MPGPNAVCEPRRPDVEALLRDATSARPEASVSHPPAVERETGPDHAILDVAAEGASHFLDHVAEGGLAADGAVAGVGAAVVPPLVAAIGLTEGWLHAWEEGDQQNIAYFSEVMRGALAYFEDRSNTIESRLQAQRSPGYADGVRRGVRLMRTDSARFDAIQAAVRRASREGQSAVALGRDRGAAFQRLYDNDPAFRHGVDYMRRLRDRDPAAFQAKAARFRQLQEQVESCRQTAVRG